MLPETSSGGSDSLRPVGDARLSASRNAAMQRRAMQAAMANAVRALRSQDGRRGRGAPTGRFASSPGGDA